MSQKLAFFYLDVQITFFNGKVKKDVYIQHPKGYVILGKETQLCTFKRVLYELKLFPKTWYTNIDAQICAQGFQRSMQTTIFTSPML
jgi:hypothetical protein